MKKFSFLFALLFLGMSIQASAQADAISKYFSKYMDDENFTVIYVSGKLFSMFDNATEGLEDKEVQAIKSVVSDMRG
jgi:vacuolar-type H+-ATPase subunit F/Vma7